MRIWRMSFRVGEGGYEMWPHCLERSVAATTYYVMAKIDLSKYPQDEPRELWAQLATARKYSLRKVAYEMKKGDIIFAKKGPNIIAKGIVKGPYRFDNKFRIVDPNGVPWAHQVPVDWSLNFSPIRISLGNQQRYTVRELTSSDVKQIDSRLITLREDAALEGQTYTRESVFRRRNAALIQSKKVNSDYRCEVCGFNFEKSYGSIGYEFIIAHHNEPVSKRKRPSLTTLNEISLLCANCHAMVHTSNPPLLPHKLKSKLKINQ